MLENNINELQISITSNSVVNLDKFNICAVIMATDKINMYMLSYNILLSNT